MRRNLVSALATLAAAAALGCADPVLGQEVGERLSDLPGYAETIAPVPAGGPAAAGSPLIDSLALPAASAPSCSPFVDALGSGCGHSGSHWGPACPQCDENPTHAIVGLFGYDSFRGVADDSWQNNGLHAGFNYGTRLGKFSEWTGLGFQVGGTVGVFDWAGTDYRPANQDKAETQGFLTYGLFRKPDENCRVSAAIVQDWMITNNYGVFSQNPTLSQLRMQVGYAVNAWNEVGVWGTVRTTNAERDVAGVGPTSWRAINQLSPYWKYKWGPGGADTTIWVGVPERDRLSGAGSLGDYLVGALANVPLGDRVGLYTLVTYMHQSAAPGGVGADEDAWNFTVGLAFYPRRNARSNTVAGQCWMPQLPVANNGYFLVDTSNH